MILRKTAMALGLALNLPGALKHAHELQPSGVASTEPKPALPPDGNAAVGAPGVLPAVKPNEPVGEFEVDPEVKKELEPRLSDWDLIDKQNNALLFSYQALLALRRDNPNLYFSCGGEIALRSAEDALAEYRKVARE